MTITHEHAFEMLGPLIACTNGWDTPKIRVWTMKLSALSYPDAAAAAIDMLTDTWDQPGAPQWANFRRAYDSTSWRMHPNTNPMPELPPAAKNQRFDRVLRSYVTKMRAELSDGLRHNHHKGADGCPICSIHERCRDGFCPRCGHLDQLFTDAAQEIL